MKNYIAYLVLCGLIFLCLGIIGVIGANIEFVDVTINVLTFKNVFLGIIKLSPLLLLVSFIVLIFQKLDK